MCQESIIEYLTSHLSKEYNVFIPLGENQIEIFGNESRKGQLKIMEELVDKSINKKDIVNIVKNKDINKLTKEQLIRIDQLLNSVKICDPAIGSGAFPMGILKEIFSIKELIAYNLQTEWKPAEVKLNIIQNSVYGVDIEKGAVDIARLRFWLSLVVDENLPKALPNLDYKIVVGDSLISKFDDEIVEIDWDRKGSTGKADEYLNNVQLLLRDVAEKQRTFFSPDNKYKKKLTTEIRHLKLELLINQLSLNKELYINKTEYKDSFVPTVRDIQHNSQRELHLTEFDSLISKIKKYQKNIDAPFNHFDWKLDFPEVLNPYLLKNEKKRGFDIVIANPPYLKERGNAHIFKAVNNSNFGKLWHQGKMDYWYYFLHKAIEIKKDTEGIIAFITSRYWLNSKGAKKIINRISNELSFINVVDIGKLKVFDNVVGQHMIHIYTSKDNNEFIYKKLQNNLSAINKDISSNDIRISIFFNKDVFRENDEIIFTNEDLSIAVETRNLGDLFDVSQGVVEAPDKISLKLLKAKPRSDLHVGQGVFVINKNELKTLKLTNNELSIIKPYLDPNDVNRYRINNQNEKYLIYSDKKNKKLIAKKNSFSNLKNHLDNLYEYITSSNSPYGLHRARQIKYFEKPKIIFKNVFIEPDFAYDENKFYFGFSFCSIIQKDPSFSLKYLLAILNSKYSKNWFCLHGKMRGVGVDIGVEKLRTFPVTQSDNQELFIKMVDYIIFLKSLKLNNSNDLFLPTYFEHIIDGMVYELYFPELLKKYNREIIRHLG